MDVGEGVGTEIVQEVVDILVEKVVVNCSTLEVMVENKHYWVMGTENIQEGKVVDLKDKDN